MDFAEFSCAIDDDGKRLDAIAKILLKNLSLSNVYSSIRKGFVLVNKKKARPNFVLHENDIVSIADFLLHEKNLQSQNSPNKISQTKKIVNKFFLRDFPYEIIFENENVIVISKPYNVSVQKDIAPFMQAYFENSSISFRASPVHRLDKKTTGILCVAKSLSCARFFSENFSHHKIQKKYLALVEGEMKNAYNWQDEIAHDKIKTNNFYTNKKTVDENEKSSFAFTRALPIAHGIYNEKKITVALFSLETGRHHQIRFQSSAHGFPLFGDNAYGAKKISEKQNLFLHASFLGLPKNEFGIPENFFSLPPKDFFSMCEKCKIDLTKFSLKKIIGNAQ